MIATATIGTTTATAVLPAPVSPPLLLFELPSLSEGDAVEELVGAEVVWLVRVGADSVLVWMITIVDCVCPFWSEDDTVTVVGAARVVVWTGVDVAGGADVVGVGEGDDVCSKDEVRSMDEEVEGSRLVGGLVEAEEMTVGGDVSAVVLNDGADVDGKSEKVVGEGEGEGEGAALVLVEFPDIVNRRSKVSLCGFLYMAVSVQATLHDAKDDGDNVFDDMDAQLTFNRT